MTDTPKREPRCPKCRSKDIDFAYGTLRRTVTCRDCREFWHGHETLADFAQFFSHSQAGDDGDGLTAGEALLRLRNEVQGFLDTCREEMIQAAGLTNVRVLERKVAEADEVLACPPRSK